MSYVFLLLLLNGFDVSLSVLFEGLHLLLESLSSDFDLLFFDLIDLILHFRDV